MLTAQNLLEIRELQGLSQEEFAQSIRRTRELVNKMERGKSPVSASTQKRIETFLYSVNPSLFSHEVNILGKPSHSHALPVKSQPYYLERQEQKKKDLPPYQVPLVGIKAQAGYVRNFEQVDEFVDNLEKYSLPPGVNPTGAVWRYFEVDGDSMEPTLNSSDLILASMMPQEDWADVKDFAVYIILLEDQLLVKRVFKKSATEWVLISDNDEAYPQKLLSVTSVKQVWTFRRHIRSRMPQPKEFKIAV
ncbi:MAG: LexA family transcriptional regulator [Chitinophagaceae bacterium]